MISCIDVSQSYLEILLHPKSTKYVTFELNHKKKLYFSALCNGPFSKFVGSINSNENFPRRATRLYNIIS